MNRERSLDTGVRSLASFLPLEMFETFREEEEETAELARGAPIRGLISIRLGEDAISRLDS